MIEHRLTSGHVTPTWLSEWQVIDAELRRSGVTSSSMSQLSLILVSICRMSETERRRMKLIDDLRKRWRRGHSGKQYPVTWWAWWRHSVDVKLTWDVTLNFSNNDTIYFRWLLWRVAAKAWRQPECGRNCRRNSSQSFCFDALTAYDFCTVLNIMC